MTLGPEPPPCGPIPLRADCISSHMELHIELSAYASLLFTGAWSMDLCSLVHDPWIFPSLTHAPKCTLIHF